MEGEGQAELLELHAVRRSYAATIGGCTVRHHALPATTLRVRRGEWVAVAGPWPGPLTLLRCAAGLVRPDGGRVRWSDRAGHEVPPPRVALVHADWRCYESWTVRDVLEAAVPSRSAVATTGGAAARRVALALGATGLDAVADRPVTMLDVPGRWRVGVAAAVAGGARWLLLEVPTAAEGPWPGDGTASLRTLSTSLAALGLGAVVAASRSAPFPVHRHAALADLAAPDAGARPGGVGGSRALARVAEGEARAWEPPPGSASVASLPGGI